VKLGTGGNPVKARSGGEGDELLENKTNAGVQQTGRGSEGRVLTERRPTQGMGRWWLRGVKNK